MWRRQTRKTLNHGKRGLSLETEKALIRLFIQQNVLQNYDMEVLKFREQEGKNKMEALLS